MLMHGFCKRIIIRGTNQLFYKPLFNGLPEKITGGIKK